MNDSLPVILTLSQLCQGTSRTVSITTGFDQDPHEKIGTLIVPPSSIQGDFIGFLGESFSLVLDRTSLFDYIPGFLSLHPFIVMVSRTLGQPVDHRDLVAYIPDSRLLPVKLSPHPVSNERILWNVEDVGRSFARLSVWKEPGLGMTKEHNLWVVVLAIVF